MTQGFTPQQIKNRTSVLVFIKGSTAPLVLYFEKPKAVYDELLEIMKTSSASAKLIEKNPTGPIKYIAFMSNQIAAVALQEEQYVQ